MTGIQCKEAKRRLRDRVEGGLEEIDTDLADHLAGCAACAGELGSLRALLAATREITASDVPDPGDAYWEAFVPSVRSRLSRRGVEGPRRSALVLMRVAAAGILMIGAASSVLLVSRGGYRPAPSATRPAASMTADDAGRRMDAALRKAPDVAGELTADLIGIDPMPEIGAREILEAITHDDRPASLSGAWVDLEDDELQRLLDGLDGSQTRTLRAELAAEHG